MRSLLLILILTLSASCATSSGICDGECEDDTGKDASVRNPDSGSPDRGNNRPDGGVADTGSDFTTDGVADVSSDAILDMGPPDMREYLCLDRPKPANRARKVLVGKTDQDVMSIYDLSTSGVLTDTGNTLPTGRAGSGRVYYTPDGSIGYVSVDGGAVAIIDYNAGGVLTLRKTVPPTQNITNLIGISGDKLYGRVLNTSAMGGGIYEIPYDCITGELGTPTRVVEADYIFSLDTTLEPWLILSTNFEGDTMRMHAYDPQTDTRLAGVNPWTNTVGFPSSIGRSHDGKLSVQALIQFDGNADTVSGVRIDGNTLTRVNEITTLADPSNPVFSPYNNAMVIFTGFGTGLQRFTVQPDNNPAFSVLGPVSLTPALSTLRSVVDIRRGDLAGTFITSEQNGIRAIQFQPNGTVTQLSYIAGTANGQIGIPP